MVLSWLFIIRSVCLLMIFDRVSSCCMVFVFVVFLFWS